jgi:hypothetical protein
VETTLLSAGIACLVAGVVGGGLKAFGIEIPVLESVPRQLAVAGLGVMLIVAAAVVPTDQTRKPVPPGAGRVTAPQAPNRLQVRYDMVGAPFIVLGKDPDEMFAPSKAYWVLIDVRLENGCSNAVHVDRTSFALTVSAGGGSSETVRPSTRGWEHVAERLRGGWLEPSETTEGLVLFVIQRRLWQPRSTYSLQYPAPNGCALDLRRS